MVYIDGLIYSKFDSPSFTLKDVTILICEGTPKTINQYFSCNALSYNSSWPQAFQNKTQATEASSQGGARARARATSVPLQCTHVTHQI